MPFKPASFWAGAAWALFAISIWAGWFISTRLDAGSGLTAYDIVALRFGVAAVILLPITIRLRCGLGLLHWTTTLALFAGSGVIYSLLTTAGVFFAPAAEGAALTPGVMPMATALLSVLLLKERLARSQITGLCLILAGVIAIAGFGLFQGAHRAWIGHILFVMGAFLFAGYTIALRRSGLSGLEAAALVSIWSSAVYLPFYAALLHPRLLEVPPASLVIPAIYQGILTNVISLFAYGRAVSALGPSRAAPFAALIPAFSALLGLAILGEHPTLADWTGIACVSCGVYAASGAPLDWLSNAVRKLR
jgi:drug/metabolite transporter (DMT)-like permease